MTDDKSDEDPILRDLKKHPGALQTEPHASEALFAAREDDPPLGSRQAKHGTEDEEAAAASALNKSKGI